MWLDVLMMAGLLAAFAVSYKCWTYLKTSIREISEKFDTIYYMLCDIFKVRHNRSNKKRKK